MSACHRCDRCGAITDGSEPEGRIANDIHGSVQFGPYERKLPSGNREVCKDCIRSFAIWWHEGKTKAVEVRPS